MDRTRFLRQLDWLQELDDEDWQELNGRAGRFVFGRGATVCEPTSNPKSIYVLESGRIRVFRLSRDGKEATLGYVEPNELIGELAAFGDFGRDSFAVAHRECVVWKIPVAQFRHWVRTRPKLVVAVTRQIGERMKRVESRVEHLILHDVRSRLATVLLEMAGEFAASSADDLEIDLSQGELASLIGASRQSVNVALSEFEADGLVRKTGRRLRLLSVERLAQLSKPV